MWRFFFNTLLRKGGGGDGVAVYGTSVANGVARKTHFLSESVKFS